ncbi:MAG: hypothetical protein WCG93_02270 [Paludibacter sp.]
MKTINRLCKAAVVIVIVGIGLVHNLNNTSIFSKSLNTVSVQLENDILANDTLKVNENRFLNYSKSVIKSSIQQLISNL